MGQDRLPPEDKLSGRPSPEDSASAGNKGRLLPHWLRQMRGWEETPPWLLQMIEQDERALPSMLSEEIEAAAALGSSDETIGGQEGEPLPAWLEESRDSEDGQASSQDAGTFSLAGQEGADWLSSLRAEVGASSAAEFVSPEEVPPFEGEELPDWLQGLEEMESTAEQGTEEPLASEQGTPDWLRGIEEGVPETPEPALPGGAEEPLAFEEEGLPDWLRGIEEEVPETPEPALPEGAEEPFAFEEEGLPDWLRGIEEEVPQAPEPTLPEGAEEPLASEEEGLPDWLRGIEEEVPEAPEPALPEGAEEPLAFEEEGLPDWLRGIEPVLSAEPDEPLAFAETGPPDWLPSEEGQGPRIQESETEEVFPSTETGLPEWLRDVEETPVMEEAGAAEGEELPDWLQSMGEVEAEDEQSAKRAGVTDWLRSVQATQLPEELLPESRATEEGMPEWLSGSVQAPEPEVGTVSASEQGVPDARMELPDWLQEAGKEPMPLRAPDEAKPSEMPDWMAEPAALADAGQAGREELDLSEGVGLEGAEIPGWLEELRIKEAEKQAEDLPVETSGPLAGLTGLLNPEPLLGIFPKSTYKPTSPITEAQLAEAKLIEGILSAPASRPVVVSHSPGREILNSLGRWMVYFALAAVMVAAAFVPQMQEWVRPPEMPEAVEFFHTIEGLPVGSEVLLVMDYDASLDGELTPQVRAIVWHLLRRGLNVATVSLNPQGAAIAQDILLSGDGGVVDKARYVQGENYINLGYLPPHPASLQAFVSNPFEGSTLWYGMVTGDTAADGSLRSADTALGQQVKGFDDLDLVVIASGSQDHVRWWIEQVGSQRAVDLLIGISAAAAPYVQPYYSPSAGGQVKGMLVGLAGAAAYETLVDAQFSPSARENLVLQSYAQIVLVAVILLGGVSVLIGRLK